MKPEPLETYHRQRDALVGKNADHLSPPATYTRGVVLPEDKRSKRISLLAVVIRIALVILFFGLFGFVFFVGLTGGE
jgi:hypothetical protein